MQLLIIEDEPRAARQLQTLLQNSGYPHHIIEVLDSVETAITFLQNPPAIDLIFMDIQLADGLSFEIFQSLKLNTPIIFTTAFDEYALQAFKVNSVDYLLKPIQQFDLNAALAKFKDNQALHIPSPALFKQLLAGMQQKTYRKGILVKEGTGLLQKRVEDFLYFFSDASYTYGVTQKKQYIINESVDKLYDSLDPAYFFRINRGKIISKNVIYRIDPYFNHRVKVILSVPVSDEFIVSRARTPDFKDWLNQ